MMRMLDAPVTKQHEFWTDQIRSMRSYPFGTFRDRASDSLLSSMLAWDTDRAAGLRLAADTRPPFDARAPAFFDAREQALEDYISIHEESEGWDYEDKDSFRVENLFPVDSGFLARRAAEDYRMTAAAAAELARLATCGREGGGEGEWEDDEAARGGGERMH
jgi:hypothetical protein